MTGDIYRSLARCLDTLPNGFPATDSGVELRILKKIFTPDEAALFCDLKLTIETAEQIVARTGRPLAQVTSMLDVMSEKGQIFGFEIGGMKIYKMLPWVFGIYEFQNHRLDRELAELCEEYAEAFSQRFFSEKPHLMQVIPVEREIPVRQEALAWEQVSSYLDAGQAFSVTGCICKKERAIMGHECDKPREVCLAIAPIPGVFDNSKHGRAISREEAYEVMRMAEEAGLVHLTYNSQGGHIFICNCCGCCCGVLRGMTAHGMAEVTNSYYYAEIDPDACISCGICADERCQVGAVYAGDGSYGIDKERCIGCGLCMSTCPADAVKLVRKASEEIETPPKDPDEWNMERARRRGVDFSKYL